MTFLRAASGLSDQKSKDRKKRLLLERNTSRELFMHYCRSDERLTCSHEMVETSTLLSRNRLLFSIAGGSYASNFIDNMFSGTGVTVKQDYPAWAWYEPFFVPGEHYLLSRRDLSDLPTHVDGVRLRWHSHLVNDPK